MHVDTNGHNFTNKYINEVGCKLLASTNKLLERVKILSKLIRECRFANTEHRNVDLRKYKQLIIDTINSTVPNKNPQVYRDHFSTDELNHSEAVLVGRALSKVPELKKYGKNITIFRLFDGRTCNAKDKPKGGRVK